MDRLKQQKDKLEREQHKLLQAHYADSVPLTLLKEEQERIGKALKNISGQMSTFQSEYAEVAKNLDRIFELLEDCGRIYKLADDFTRRCFNQAIFKKIRVREDLSLDAEYAEPFDVILDSHVFLLKSKFEKSIYNKNDGQPESTAHQTLSDFIVTMDTKPTVKHEFFTVGLSMDCLVWITGLEPRSRHGNAQHCRSG